jgi:23S rRNA pseudouridine1911/1915/1917 synthase
VSAVIKLSSPATREFWEVPVVFEDEHLLALDKPSRLLTSPDRYDPDRPNLMKLLHRDIARSAPWARQRQLTYLANAHRLDFETSGVLLLAKDKPTLVELADLFGTEKPEKQYLGLVHGTPVEPAFKVGAKLGPHPVKVGLVRVDEKQGKRALTHFEVLERFRGYTLLKCTPMTGRTHQIRVHLQNSGLPLVGDALYGGSQLLLSSLKPGYRLKPRRVERPLISRVALHAEQLKLPWHGQTVEMTTPWPRDLQVAVKYLRRYASTSPVVGEQAHEAHAEGGGDDEQEES